MARIWSLENEMFRKFIPPNLDIQNQCLENVHAILGSEHSGKLEELWRYKQPFKFHIIINCHQLLADFCEDLEFHFTFGLDAILRRIIAFSRGRPITSLGRNHIAAALVSEYDL
jgi:hypothetical protein